MPVGERFYPYDKVKRGRKEGGKVYISCAANGETGFHEGWLPEKEAARLDRARARAEAKSGGKEDQAAAKPELTRAAIRYLDLHRQNAVRVELLNHPQIALRLIVASVISGDGLWDVRPESQSADGNKAVAASLAARRRRQEGKGPGFAPALAAGRAARAALDFYLSM
jgi:ParB family transcriptional regulator, chromosome partitioning protein